jgi:hypothetical protein
MDLSDDDRSSLPQQIAGKSIRRSKWNRLHGRMLASLIGG